MQSRIVRIGTVIAFDDVWDLPCAAGDSRIHAYGELRAAVRASVEFGLRLRCVCGPCSDEAIRLAAETSSPPGWRAYYVVTAIDVDADSRSSTGVHSRGVETPSAESVRSFMQRSRRCQRFRETMPLVRQGLDESYHENDA